VTSSSCEQNVYMATGQPRANDCSRCFAQPKGAMSASAGFVAYNLAIPRCCRIGRAQEAIRATGQGRAAAGQ